MILFLLNRTKKFKVFKNLYTSCILMVLFINIDEQLSLFLLSLIHLHV